MDTKRDKFSRLPGISTLIAFETAARLGTQSQAARELRTSQSAISRHIADLEKQLSVRLFERSPTGVHLTDAGSRFRDAVVDGLGIIRTAAAEIAEQPGDEQVVIAFPYWMAHLLITPRYDALQEALGEQVRIDILNQVGRNAPQLSQHPVADVFFIWEASGAVSVDRVVTLKEAVRPLCSPGYAAAHAEILNGPVSGWGGLTFLDITQPSQGWTSWEEWFEAAGCPALSPRFTKFDDYLFVLEMAATGHGIVLGWRGFFERYIETGALVELADGFVETDNAYYCALTEKGRTNPTARKCMEFFEQLA